MLYVMAALARRARRPVPLRRRAHCLQDRGRAGRLRVGEHDAADDARRRQLRPPHGGLARGRADDGVREVHPRCRSGRRLALACEGRRHVPERAGARRAADERAGHALSRPSAHARELRGARSGGRRTPTTAASSNGTSTARRTRTCGPTRRGRRCSPATSRRRSTRRSTRSCGSSSSGRRRPSRTRTPDVNQHKLARERALRHRHRRRRLGGLLRSRTGSAPTRRRACSCSRRGGPTTSGTSSSTCPPGSRRRSATGFYDWKYESEPEPHMNGRRIYHARGKVLGGSSSINGMIFQRGNPLDYERWGADAGMETWDYAHCLPYFKRMETLPRRRGRVPRRGRPARARARPGDEPAVRGVLRGRAAGGLSAHRRRQRLPAGGLRRLRPQHPPRPQAQRRARVPPPGHAPAEPRGAVPQRSSTASCSTARARSGSR